ncbi:hypothetical protein CAter10_0693 [Collimonas arenae]|nr:hypothetical protein CAter10_0693 [Collimonas arenae]
MVANPQPFLLIAAGLLMYHADPLEIWRGFAADRCFPSPRE